MFNTACENKYLQEEKAKGGKKWLPLAEAGENICGTTTKRRTKIRKMGTKRKIKPRKKRNWQNWSFENLENQ